MAYNKVEAQTALNAFAATANSDSSKQYEAAKRLLRELAQLQKPTGLVRLTYDQQHECIEVEIARVGFRRIWFGARDMRFKISEFVQDKTTRDLSAKVKYDALSDEFVGTDIDSSIVPTPGAKHVMRDAIAAVIDAIARDMLAAQH